MKKLIIILVFILAACGQPQIVEPIQVVQTETSQALSEPIEINEPAESPIPIYDIPMSAELQEYTFNLCQRYELSYELVLAVINTESRFIETADSGNSKGLMQLSRGTGDWVSEQLGIRDFDPFNPEQNIACGVWYLNYLRGYWREQGFNDESVFALVALAYNRGITGAKNYVEKYGLDNKYVESVYEYKIMLEQQGD